ncbi:MAG: RluA family pseudouridine synthase [bacterium]|nr:RluA family pseudouridine synthase [bacterium]
MSAARTLRVDAPMRLDAFLARAALGCSRRVLRALVADGSVRVNGRRTAKGARLVAGDVVTLPPLDGLHPEPDLAVDVLHVERDLVVVAKPGGMRGHALDPRQTGTVAAFLAARFPETAAVGDALASGLVHRLDTGTSGLLVAARHAAAHDRLRAAFARGSVTKRYLALVTGTPPATTTVTHALAHDRSIRGRMRVARPGDRAWEARSEVTTLRRADAAALVGVTIRTGVTHQVRAHLAALGCPVVGDARYGGVAAALPLTRHALHAAGVTLPSRDGAAAWSFWSPLPDDLAALAATLGIG